jgi:hypothetical protein
MAEIRVSSKYGLNGKPCRHAKALRYVTSRWWQRQISASAPMVAETHIWTLRFTLSCSNCAAMSLVEIDS